MPVDEETPLIIGSMIEMGHKLGYQTIAEGIETPNQLDMIRKLGCKTVQGYLFSKPVLQLERTGWTIVLLFYCRHELFGILLLSGFFFADS